MAPPVADEPAHAPVEGGARGDDEDEHQPGVAFLTEEEERGGEREEQEPRGDGPLEDDRDDAHAAAP